MCCGPSTSSLAPLEPSVWRRLGAFLETAAALLQGRDVISEFLLWKKRRAWALPTRNGASDPTERTYHESRRGLTCQPCESAVRRGRATIGISRRAPQRPEMMS
jgi:hypothetical protein